MQGQQSKAKNYLFISFLVTLQINEDKDKDNNTNNTKETEQKDKLIARSRK